MLPSSTTISARALRGTISMAALVMGYAPTTLAAQAVQSIPGSGGLDDIVVTAQRREQPVQSVGISLTAIDGEALRRLGARESVDALAQAPGVQNSSPFGPGNNPNIAIRGVALNDFNDGTEAPVGVYLDDVYLVPLGATSFPLYDMSRVEVLRGPQGTLFGRNTTGGIVHYVTNGPELQRTSGSIEAEYGRYESRNLTGYVNLPLGRNFAVRLSGNYRDNDGWIRNREGQADGGVIDTRGLRAQASYVDGPLTADLKFDYSHVEGPSSVIHSYAAYRDPVTGLVVATGDRDQPWKEGFNDRPTTLKGVDSYTAQGRVGYDLGAAKLTSITGYNRYSKKYIEDCEGSAAPNCAGYWAFRSEQVSEEVRLEGLSGPLRWTAGGYYLHQNAAFNGITALFFGGGGIPQLMLEPRYRQSIASYAAFGNVEYALDRKLSAIFGLRWTKDRKSFSERLRAFTTDSDLYDLWPRNPFGFNDTGTVADIDFGRETVGDLATIDKANVALKAELDYRPDDDALLYLSFSRGTKAGGFNNGYLDLTTVLSTIPYKGETLYAYEGGAKLALLDHRLRVNASAFAYDYRDYQTLTFIDLGSRISNRNATSYGLELEVQTAPVRGLTLSLGGSLMHSRVRGVPTPTGVVADREMILAPDWGLNGSARYERPFASGRLAMQADFKATARYHSDIVNNRELDISSYFVANARVEYVLPGDRYRVGAFVRNLTDNKYRLYAFDFTGTFGVVNQQFSTPRWYGVTVAAFFG